MNRIGWTVGPCRLLCVVGLAALLAACGFGSDPDAQSSNEDTGLMSKARNLALEQFCKRSSACADEESREAIKALGDVLQQLPKEARRQLAEADMNVADVTEGQADDSASPLSGAGLAGLMEMARSMLEADAGQGPSPGVSSDAGSTEIGPEIAGQELVSRLEGIPVKSGKLTPDELRQRLTSPPAEE